MKKTLLILVIIFLIQFEANAQHYSGSFNFDGYTREYEVYLPQDYQSNMPMVVAIHGIYETIDWFKDYTKLNEVADTSGFIVFPRDFSSHGRSDQIPLTQEGIFRIQMMSDLFLP